MPVGSEVGAEHGQTAACAEQPVDHLVFCSSCQSDHQRHPLARLVVSIPFNVIVFVAVFALQGYTPSSLWPSLAYLFYFYTMAAVVALRTYELQRLLLLLLFGTSAALILVAKEPVRPVGWLELSIGSGLVVLILTKSEVKRKWGAFALLTLVWTEGEAFLRRITPEPDFGVALRTAWETITGQHQHELLPSLVTIGIGRSIYLLGAASLAFGIYIRRRSLAHLAIPHLLRHLPVFRKLPAAREIKGPRHEKAGSLVELVLFFVDFLLLLLNIAVMVFCVVGNFLISAIEWFLRSVLLILDATLRAIVYMSCLVALLVAGTAEALWLSFLETLRSVALACVLWLGPFAASLIFVQSSVMFAGVVDATLRTGREPDWIRPCLYLCSSFMGCLLLGAWALAPRGDGYGWWREREATQSYGVGLLHDTGAAQLSMLRASVQNYLKRAAVVSLGAYILNLLIFDTYGHFSGGPYDYGRPFVLAIVLLVLGLIALLWIKLRS